MNPIDKLINKQLSGEDAEMLITEAISTDSNGEVDANFDNPRVSNVPGNENTQIIIRQISKAIKTVPLPVKEIAGLMGELGIKDTADMTKLGYDASQYSSLDDLITKQAGFLIKILNMVIPMANKKYS